MLMKVGDHAKGRCEFTYFRAGVLYYKTDTGFEFPVPADDTNGSSFVAACKSVELMRWIRKHIDVINAERALATPPAE